MRREEKKIANPAEIQEIIAKALVCRLGVCDGDQPYVVPMSFGHEGGVLYFHCARVGRKLDAIRANPKVCFEIDTDVEIVTGETSCRWTMKYRSIIGFGTAEIIEDPEEVRRALDVIVRHYSDQPPVYREEVVPKTRIIKVAITEMTAEKSGF